MKEALRLFHVSEEAGLELLHARVSARGWDDE
jgi:hypothetical protein